VISHGPIGFFGKIPAQGDFVRANVGDGLVQRFTRWLEESSEACHKTRAQVPREPVRFLFRPAGEVRALVGVLRGSQDRVGRVFPLAAFVPAQGPHLEQASASAPLAYAAFFSAMAEAVAQDPASPAALGDRLGALKPPGAEELARAEEAARAAASRTAGDFLGPLFGDAPAGKRHYAVNTFLAACNTVRGREPARAETVLDCPVRSDGDAWAWLELARRALRWPGAPTWFLRAGSPGRLLLSLGPPPPAVLPSLAEPRKDSPKIWPLETAVASATEAARKALGPRAAVLDRDDATLGALASELAGGDA
jgi:type VI secretion system protein ImpM